MELHDLYVNEQVFWAQRAKADWLKLGDKNTTFLQTKVNIRKRCNTISKLKTDADIWINDQKVIEDLLVHDF